MDMPTIVHVMAEAIAKTLYNEWHHDGHIQVEHSDGFGFTLNGQEYRVSLDKVRK